MWDSWIGDGIVVFSFVPLVIGISAVEVEEDSFIDILWLLWAWIMDSSCVELLIRWCGDIKLVNWRFNGVLVLLSVGKYIESDCRTREMTLNVEMLPALHPLNFFFFQDPGAYCSHCSWLQSSRTWNLRISQADVYMRPDIFLLSMRISSEQSWYTENISLFFFLVSNLTKYINN